MKRYIIAVLALCLIAIPASAEVWEENTFVVNGLPDIGAYSSPTVYDDSGTLKLISGDNVGGFHGYYWSGSAWVSDSSIVSGLSKYDHPSVFNDSGTLKLIGGDADGTFGGYYWNGSAWVSDSSIVNGLPDLDIKSTPTVYDDSGTWKLISGSSTGWHGYYWSGSAWVSDSSIVSGISGVGSGSPHPSVYNDSGTLKLITGEYDGIFTGYYWSGSAWVSDSFIVNGLPDVGTTSSPTVYDDSGTWKLISGNQAGTFTGFEFVYESIDLASPANTTTLNYNYPPLLHSVPLEWDATVDPDMNSYKYQVSETEEFTIISSEGYTADTTTTASLAANTYYWRVYTYNSTTETLGGVSDVWTFTVAETGGAGTGTAIAGVVYTKTDGSSTELNNVVITIHNNTWSDQMTTGENGYYLFDNLASSETYFIQATKPDYTDSQIQYVTTVSSATVTRNILMELREDESQYYTPHKVKFVVKTIWGTAYPGVDVKVYKGSEVNSLYSGTTGTDGVITFKLDEEVEYRLTFVNSTLGIDEEITIYPMSSLYNIYPTTEEVDRDSDDIKFGAIGSNINLTAGYINASFLDSSGTTTLAELWINDQDGTNLYHFSTTNSSATWSQVVAANNTTYLVHFELQNTELAESFLQDRVITFSEGVTGPFNFGFTEQWHYQLLGTAMILFVGLLFGAVNAQMGAVVVVLLGWFNVYTGWYPSNVKTILMMMLATLVAFGFYLRKGEDIR